MNKSKIEWQVGYYDKPADERLSREDCTVEIDLFDPTESDLRGDRCQAALVRVVELVAAGKHDITVTKMDDDAPVESFTWSPEIGHVVADLDDGIIAKAFYEEVAELTIKELLEELGMKPLVHDPLVTTPGWRRIELEEALSKQRRSMGL